MSYDLCFWRQTKALELSPSEICSRLGLDETMDGIALLPIQEIKAAILSEFPDIDDELTQMTWDSNDSYFQIEWPIYATHISVSFGFNLPENPKPLNKLIDLMGSFGCALYDLHTDERFEQPDLPETGRDL